MKRMFVAFLWLINFELVIYHAWAWHYTLNGWNLAGFLLSLLVVLTGYRFILEFFRIRS